MLDRGDSPQLRSSLLSRPQPMFVTLPPLPGYMGHFYALTCNIAYTSSAIYLRHNRPEGKTILAKAQKRRAKQQLT